MSPWTKVTERLPRLEYDSFAGPAKESAYVLVRLWNGSAFIAHSRAYYHASGELLEPKWFERGRTYPLEGVAEWMEIPA